jgi:hypothetical protein
MFPIHNGYATLPDGRRVPVATDRTKTVIVPGRPPKEIPITDLDRRQRKELRRKYVDS